MKPKTSVEKRLSKYDYLNIFLFSWLSMFPMSLGSKGKKELEKAKHGEWERKENTHKSVPV